MPEGVARQRWRWERKASVLVAKVAVVMEEGRRAALDGGVDWEDGACVGAGTGTGTGSPVGRSMGLSSWGVDSVMLVIFW